MPEGYVDFLGVEEDESVGEVVRLCFNYYSEEDESFYKGVEMIYPWNSARLSSHVSAEGFAKALSSKAEADYGLQEDLLDYISSGRDDSMLPGVLNSCKSFCSRVQAQIFSVHGDEIEYEVENQAPVVRKSLVDHFRDNEKDVRSRVVIDESVVGLGDEPVQRIDFVGKGKDGLRFRLNYVKDGKLCPGIPVCVKGISDAESQQALLYRIDAMMSVDDGVLNDQLAYYCDNRGSSDKTAAGIADNSFMSVQAALYDMVVHYSQDQERFHQYDVKAEKASQLVEVDSSLEGKLRVSLNYKTGKDLYRKGITLDMDCPSWCKSDKDVALFRDCIQKRYAEGNFDDIYRQVSNWVGGHDTIAAIRKDAKADRSKKVFESCMEERKASLENASVSFLSEVRSDFENESLFSDMQRAYGEKNNLVEIIRSDDDSVMLRFNYRHRDAFDRNVFAGENGDTELSPVQNGVVYTMSWYGADSLNLSTKARFIELLESQLEKDTELQERICRYNLRRFRDGDTVRNGDTDVRLRLDDDGCSAEMAAWLREFEQDLKYNLPALRKQRMDKEDEENKVLRMRFESCAMALKEDDVRRSRLGTFGKFRMIIMHYDKWKEQEARRAELDKEYSEVSRKCKLVDSLGGVSARGGELLKSLQDVYVPSASVSDKDMGLSVSGNLDVSKSHFGEETVRDKHTAGRDAASAESVPEVVFDVPKKSNEHSL